MLTRLSFSRPSFFLSYPDNIHQHPHLIPAHLVDEIHTAFPRLKWGGCFAQAMELEIAEKPWAHATELRETKGEAWDKIETHQMEKEFA